MSNVEYDSDGGLRVQLPKKWVDFLTDSQESGMGYHIVRITMSYGVVLDNRKVVNSEWLLLGDDEEDFNVEQITDIELPLLQEDE